MNSGSRSWLCFHHCVGPSQAVIGKVLEGPKHIAMQRKWDMSLYIINISKYEDWEMLSTYSDRSFPCSLHSQNCICKYSFAAVFYSEHNPLILPKDNSTAQYRTTSAEPKPDAISVSHLFTLCKQDETHFMYLPRLAGSGYPRATAPSEAQKRPALVCKYRKETRVGHHLRQSTSHCSDKNKPFIPLVAISILSPPPLDKHVYIHSGCLYTTQPYAPLACHTQWSFPSTEYIRINRISNRSQQQRPIQSNPVGNWSAKQTQKTHFTMSALYIHL